MAELLQNQNLEPGVEVLSQRLAMPWGNKIRSLLANGLEESFTARINRLMADSELEQTTDGKAFSQKVKGDKLSPVMAMLIEKAIGKKVDEVEIVLKSDERGLARQIWLDATDSEGSHWRIVYGYSKNAKLQEVRLSEKLGDERENASRQVTIHFPHAHEIETKNWVADVRRTNRPAGQLSKPIFLRWGNAFPSERSVAVKELLEGKGFLGSDKTMTYTVHWSPYDPHTITHGYLDTLKGDEKKGANILLTTDPTKLSQLGIEVINVGQPLSQREEIDYRFRQDGKNQILRWKISGARKAVYVERDNGSLYEIQNEGDSSFGIGTQHDLLDTKDYPATPAVPAGDPDFQRWLDNRVRILTENSLNDEKTERQKIQRVSELNRNRVKMDLLAKHPPDQSVIEASFGPGQDIS